jgi:hypothetical protein
MHAKPWVTGLGARKLSLPGGHYSFTNNIRESIDIFIASPCDNQAAHRNLTRF